MDKVIQLNMDSSLKELSKIQNVFKKLELFEFADDELETQSNSYIKNAFNCLWGCVSKVFMEEFPFEKLNLLVEQKIKLLESMETIVPDLYEELSYSFRNGIGCKKNPNVAAILVYVFNSIINDTGKISISSTKISEFLSLIYERNLDIGKCAKVLFNKDQMNRLFKIVCLCAKQNGFGTAENIANFGITDPARLFEIAKRLAQQNDGGIAENIANFGITDPDHLFEIAKLCAQHGVRGTAKHIVNFGIADRDRLFEIAMLCAQHSARGVAENKINFGITESDRIFEIVKLCAQQDSRWTAESIVTFGISDPHHLFVIAKLCAQQNGRRTAENIAYFKASVERPNFGITDPDRLFEIAKLCAQQDGEETARNIKNFGITNPDCLFEIAKLCAHKSGGGTAHYIANFGITNPDQLFELAKICSKQDGCETAHFIANFGITDPDHLFEIAKLCAQQNGWGTARYISNFGITNSDRLFEIAKICAQQDGRGSAVYIANFGITDPDHLFEIAKLCAQQSGVATARYISNFGITDRDHLFEIGLLCMRNCPSERDRLNCVFDYLTKALRLNNAISLQIFGNLTNNSEDFNLTVEYLSDYESQEFANSPFKEVFTLIASIEEPHIRFQNYELLANVMVLSKALLNEDQIQCLRQNKILESIFNFGRPNLKFPLFFSVALLVRTSEGFKKIEALKGHLDGQKSLIQLLAAKLELGGIDPSLFLKNMQKVSLFRVKENQHALIEMLLLLTEVETPYKQLALERICNEVPLKATTEKREGAFLRNIQSVISIIEFQATDQLKDQSRSLSTISEDILKEKLSCGDIEDFASKYNEKFRTSRNPSAIVTYASKIKNDKKASDFLGTFLTSTLNGTFLEDRYNLDNNPHLQKLNEYDSELIGKWKSNQSIHLRDLNLDPSKVVNQEMTSKEWVEQKIANKHLKQFQLDDLDAYLKEPKKGTEIIKKLGMLKGNLGKELKKTKESAQVNNLEIQLDTITLQLLCIQYIEVSDHTLPRLRREYAQETDSQKKDQIDIQIKSAADQLKQYLEQLYKIVSKEVYVPCEFSHDLKGHIKENKEVNASLTIGREIVVETDDPIDILLCGTEVNGSCQRVDGDSNLNRGLLGYLMNGNKLLAVKGPDGTIKSRCLLRLLWDGDRPVLFMEPLYPDKIKDQHRQALVHLAKQKAEQLGIPLCSLEAGQDYGKPLHALGGPSPYEYCDAVRGLTDGKYTIENAKII